MPHVVAEKNHGATTQRSHSRQSNLKLSKNNGARGRHMPMKPLSIEVYTRRRDANMDIYTKLRALSEGISSIIVDIDLLGSSTQLLLDLQIAESSERSKHCDGEELVYAAIVKRHDGCLYWWCWWYRRWHRRNWWVHKTLSTWHAQCNGRVERKRGHWFGWTRHRHSIWHESKRLHRWQVLVEIPSTFSRHLCCRDGSPEIAALHRKPSSRT